MTNFFTKLIDLVRPNLQTGEAAGAEPAGTATRRWDDLQSNTRYVSLDFSGSNIEELPRGISVQFAMNLRGCTKLRRLPVGLHVGSLNVSGCHVLEGLPEGLVASFVDISDCDQIDSWPMSATIRVGRLRARNCLGLPGLPPWLGRLSQLDLAGCAQLDALPEGLEVSSWVDVGGTGIRSLPPSLTGVGLRWRGVVVDERIAFRPDEISVQEVLQEPNAERRRVMMERVGFERFLAEANPAVLDADTDLGGKHELYHVELAGDEPLVCVSVGCPSTGRRYMIRVPPTTLTCRQAVAWTAGFDNPNDYKPSIET